MPTQSLGMLTVNQRKNVMARLQYFFRINKVAMVVLLVLLLMPGTAPSQDPPADTTSTATQAQTKPVDSPSENESTAVITHLSGKSVQFSPDGGKTWSPAKKQTKLGENAALRTGFASRCEISFANQTIIQVEPLSSIRVGDYTQTKTSQKVRANIQYGALRCGVEKGRIKSDVQISTPVSTMSIRGTIVYVEYDRGTRRCLLRVDEDGPAIARLVASTDTADPGATKKLIKQKIAIPEPNVPEPPAPTDHTVQARAFAGRYELDEGMDTDCALSRYLRLAIFRRAVWVTGNYTVDGITENEAEALIYNDSNIEPTSGALQFNDSRSVHEQSDLSPEIDIDPTPIGDSPEKEH